MLLLLQNVLYCLLYALLIKCAVRNDGRNCLYFYPKEYIEEAQKRGIADKETVMKRSKWFMILQILLERYAYSEISGTSILI
jgi:hypothetical protein